MPLCTHRDVEFNVLDSLNDQPPIRQGYVLLTMLHVYQNAVIYT